jgi:hypothetical protein
MTTEQTTDQVAETTAQTIPYRSAVSRGRTAWNAASRSLWTLAEIAANVETAYGDNTLAKLADAIAPGDLSGNTLANYRTVWQTYVTDAGDTRDTVNNNSFSVHERFAGENFNDDRLELLAARHWTTAEARALAKARRNGDPDPDFDSEGDGDGDNDGEGASAGVVEPVNKLDKLRAKAAELEAKWLKVMAQIDALEAEQAAGGIAPEDTAPEDTAPVKHIVGGGVPEHDADSPHAACPVCKEAGIAPEVTPASRAGSARRTRRSRRQPAGANA